MLLRRFSTGFFHGVPPQGSLTRFTKFPHRVPSQGASTGFTDRSQGSGGFAHDGSRGSPTTVHGVRSLGFTGFTHEVRRGHSRGSTQLGTEFQRCQPRFRPLLRTLGRIVPFVDQRVMRRVRSVDNRLYRTAHTYVVKARCDGTLWRNPVNPVKARCEGTLWTNPVDPVKEPCGRTS